MRIESSKDMRQTAISGVLMMRKGLSLMLKVMMRMMRVSPFAPEKFFFVDSTNTFTSPTLFTPAPGVQQAIARGRRGHSKSQTTHRVPVTGSTPAPGSPPAAPTPQIRAPLHFSKAAVVDIGRMPIQVVDGFGKVDLKVILVFVVALAVD